MLNKTTTADPQLFFKSHDPNDAKLGQIVTSDEKDYSKSKFVLIGCPQDEGVKRNNGRVGASEAPDKIRECLYKLSAPPKLNRGELFDAGNIVIESSLEQTHENQTQVVSKFLLDGKRVIVLGGGNDISYPDCQALAKLNKSFLAFNIDSHFDVRENKVRNSGTPYRQLLEEKVIDPKLFFELASQPFANSPVYSDYLKSKQVSVIPLNELRKKGIAKTLKAILSKKKAAGIFWGIDMDSVRSADAPGVSASYPTGLTVEEILTVASIAGSDKRSRIFEISEVNPKFDLDNHTCKLAALLILKFLKE